MPKLNLKHKDDIVIRLADCQDKALRGGTAQAAAVNHGWVQSLKWVLGFTDLIKTNKEENNSEEKDTETKS